MKVKIPCQLLIRVTLGMALCGSAQQAWATTATTTTMAVTSGGDPVTTVTWGSVVTLTATVTAGGSAVTTGQVNFCDATAAHCTDIHRLGTAQLTSAGTAALKFVPGIGSHSYEAVFEGTNSDTASSSSASALAVTGKYPTTATIAQSGSAGNYTLTATVAGYVNETGLASPTGTVSFLDTSNGNAVLGTAALGTGASALGWLNPQTPGTGNGPDSVVVGDFNGDGIPDLALANGGSTFTYEYYLTIFLGNGDGTFAAAVSPLTGDYPSSIAVADFNGDGIADLAVTNYIYDNVTILLGNGDGTFTATVALPGTGSGPDSVAVGDFNGDGIPDLAVANDYSNTVTILLGKGDGTFTATAVSPATGNVPVSVAAGDFNGDGKADLAVANYKDGTVTILLGNGDGTFTATAVSPATGTEPYSVAVGDFKGNGKADLAVANKNGGNAGTVTILLSNGDGTFTAAAESPATGNGPESVAVGDFNGDGKADLAVANYKDGTLTILLGNGDGTFTPAGVSPATGNGPDFVAVGDFIGRGVSDLAVANYTDNTATVLLTENRAATAKASGIAPTATGTHLVEASYPGDGNYSSSLSATTALTVPAPTPVTFSPTTVAFGTQNVGVASSPQVVNVSNTGTANLTISTVAIGGTNAGDFAKSNDACTGATLIPTASCTVSVTFTPTAVGSRGASLNFTDNATGSPQALGLTGTGIAPHVTLSTTSVSFGNQPVGTTSTPSAVTVVNDGTAALIFTSLAVTGDFAVATSGTTCSASAPVEVNNDCVINLTFAPTATGGRSGSLTLTDNAKSSPQVVSLSGTGTAPIVILSTTSVSFGNQPVGTTSAASAVTVNNTGTASLTFASITVTGDFAIAASGATCSASAPVAAGSNCVINVTFTPTATGSRSGSLTLTDNASGSPQVVGLSGTGTAPSVSLSATSVSFGNQLLGTPSAASAVTVTNTGTANLSIPTVTIGGTNASDFAKSADNCTGATVTPNGACTVSVTFTPSATGSRSGSLNFADNASNSPQVVNLTGTGIVAVAVLAPGSLTFSNQSLGTTSGPQPITLSNTGSAALTVTSIATSANFGETNACAGSVAAGGSCTINVTFSPTATGPLTGTLTITDNNNGVAGSTQMVNLSGTGTAPSVSLNTTGLSFGNQPVGTTSAASAVTVTNTGTANLMISTVTMGGPNASDFAKSADNCTGATVTPNGACTVSVTFTPSATGRLSASLNFTDNASNSPQVVNLTGTGIVAVAALAPGSLTFSNQSLGTTSGPQPVTLSNTGSAALTITSIAASANFGETNTCAGSVAAGSSCTINVTFSPTATGPLTGTLTITDNNNGVLGSTQTVNLSGTGTAPLVSLSVPSLSFGNQPLSTASAAQPVTVTNTGTANLTISTVTIGGTNASDFAKSADNCSGATVVPNATCTVSVTFTPSATGSRGASLIFADSASNSPQTVTLGGTGTAAGVSLSTTSVSFGNQPVGTTSNSQTVTLTNTGNVGLTLSAIAVTAPFAIATSGTTCSTSNPVAAAAACTVALTFTPTAAGAASGSLSFSDNAPHSPQTIALSGMGQDFTLAASSGSSTSATVAPGQPATYTLSVGGEAGFNQSLGFTCTGAPSEATCTVSPSTLTPGSSATNITVSVTTTAPSLSAPRSRPLPPVPPLSPSLKGLMLLALALAAMGWAIGRRNQPGVSRWRSTMVPLASGLLLTLALAGCGGGGGSVSVQPNPGTPAGSYTLTVTGTAGSGSSAVSHSVTLTLTVT